MIFFLAGPIYGKLGEFYAKVEELSKIHTPSYVLQVGSYGCFPDPSRLSRSMRSHGSATEFSRWYIEDRPVPHTTIFCSGKHEDHRWMGEMLSRGRTEILPGLIWLVNGYSTTLGFEEEACNILSLGKVYSPITYKEGRGKIKKRLAHYTRSEVEKACSAGPVDLLMAADSPDMPGLPNIIYATRPQLVIHGRNIANYDSCSTLYLSEMDIVPVKWEDKKFTFL